MEGWRECTLEETLEITSSKRIFYDDYRAFGVPFYRSKEIIEKSCGQQVSTDIYISEKKFNEIKDKFGAPTCGDILLTSVGTIGIPYVVGNEEFYFKDGNLTWFKNFSKVIYNSYLKYWLISPLGKSALDEIVIGSTQQALTIAGLKTLKILLPTFAEQQAIAAVLSCLDDKIDLLHRQNKTLEALAQTLFRQWFVEEADEGWEEVSLAKVCHIITKGTTPTSIGGQFVDYGINFIKAESISDCSSFLYDKFAFISIETHEQLKRSILNEDDVLLTIAGTIGRVAIVERSILPANTNQAIAILRPNKSFIAPEIIYLYLKSDMIKEVIDGKIVHAVQPNLSLGEIGSIKILLPKGNKLNSYTILLQSIFKNKIQNQNQICTLTKLRDTLLPKLMSGEVRVEA